jgi:phage protein D
MNAPLYYSSRPRLDLDGQAADDMVRDVAALEVSADIHGLRRARLELTALGPQAGAGDEALQWLDGARLKLGSALAVSLGPVDVARVVFDGKVSAIGVVHTQGNAPLAQVSAEDRLWDLRNTRRIKTWEHIDLAGLANAIAGEHGLSAQVDATSPTWPVLQQWNDTDLAFLRSRCAAVGAELWLDGSTLHVAPREARAGGDLTLVQGNDLLALDVDCDLAQQRSSVAVSGFDANARDKVDESAGTSELGGVAAGGTSGLDALRRAFGERKTHRLHDVPLEGEQARARAKAELLRRARGFVRARGVTTGSPTLDVGTRLRLERVGKLFEGGGYVVVEVAHRFDQREGYRTWFVAERAAILTEPQ